MIPLALQKATVSYRDVSLAEAGDAVLIRPVIYQSAGVASWARTLTEPTRSLFV